MIVKDLIQFLSDFDENMEVGIKSLCGFLNIITNVTTVYVKDEKIVLLKGVLPAEYRIKEEHKDEG